MRSWTERILLFLPYSHSLGLCLARIPWSKKPLLHCEGKNAGQKDFEESGHVA
jgi:hypothetical protein